MKKILAITGIMMLGFAVNANAGYVRGYTKSNGTYVQPHYRTSPNSTRSDNYSSQGNYNPYSGQVGTVNPYKESFNKQNGLTGKSDYWGR